MKEKNIKEKNDPWQSGMAKNITFIVTKDCQLACKYCYLVGKNEKERMSWEVAKQAIDYILDNEQDFREESVVWDFIGGEPFLEIDLIDKICDYLKSEMFRRDHHWFNSYRFSFSTNGINYDTEKVQNFIKKNRDHLSIGITIDGTEVKHDINRVYKGNDERGSYKDVVRNIPLWLQQFPNAGTKVTIASPDIPYIKESVLHLYSLGIKEVNINCVFEDVWEDGDDKKFEDQLADVKAATDGLGAEFLIQCTGVAAAAKNAWKMVRRGGGMCEVGFFMDGGECSINHHFDICNKEIALVGSWVYTPQDYPTTFAFLKRAKGIGLPVEELVTHHFDLADIQEALETNVQMKGIKVAVTVK